MIFFSSEYQEASALVIVTSLVVKYFPESLLNRMRGYWYVILCYVGVPYFVGQKLALLKVVCEK